MSGRGSIAGLAGSLYINCPPQGGDGVCRDAGQLGVWQEVYISTVPPLGGDYRGALLWGGDCRGALLFGGRLQGGVSLRLRTNHKPNYQSREHLPLRRKLRRDSTFPERLLWSQLRGKLLGYRFRRQYSIRPYIVDFYCPYGRLVVEVDGEQHASPEMQLQDNLRDKYLNNIGLEVLRFSAREIKESTEGVCVEISRKCRERIEESAPL